jgi:hypothetical protein
MGAADDTLRNFEQARLNRAANLAKEISLMEQERQKECTAADVARWLLENRQELLRTVGSHLDVVGKSEAA